MPVGGSILAKYGSDQEPPRRPASPRIRPDLVFFAGLAVLVTLTWWSLDDPRGLAVFRVVTITGIALFVIARAVQGWREDGIMGVIYRLKHPMGTALAGDEDRSPMARSLGALFLLAILANVSVSLIMISRGGAGVAGRARTPAGAPSTGITPAPPAPAP
ncbi:MAG: hypothetical protein AMXMBFR58_26780 [Phycisphaerae bacterium]